MSNKLTDFRDALVTYLAEQFPGAELIGGQREATISRDSDRICVFWDDSRAWPVDVKFLQPKIVIQFFKQAPTSSVITRGEVVDDGPLEQAAWDLAQALDGVLTGLVDGFSFYVARLRPVRDTYHVEADLALYGSAAPFVGA